MTTGPAGEQDGRCAWCGWLIEVAGHKPGCYVPGYVGRLAASREATQKMEAADGSKTGPPPAAVAPSRH